VCSNEYSVRVKYVEKNGELSISSQRLLNLNRSSIDLLTSVSKVATHDIFKNAVNGKLEEFNVLYISKDDLITCKKAAGRAKDLADVEELEKINT